MSTIKEMLDGLTKEIESLNEAMNQIDEDIKEIQEEKKALAEKKSFVEEKVENIKGILIAVQEPFDTILALSVAGNITPADLKTFAYAVGLEFDDKFIEGQQLHEAQAG